MHFSKVTFSLSFQGFWNYLGKLKSFHVFVMLMAELLLFKCGNLPQTAEINEYNINSLLTSMQTKIKPTLATAILLKGSSLVFQKKKKTCFHWQVVCQFLCFFYWLLLAVCLHDWWSICLLWVIRDQFTHQTDKHTLFRFLLSYNINLVITRFLGNYSSK